MSVTVESLLQQKALEFIPSGRDFLLKCINPEHEDNNPSLRIDRLTGIGHCFSCGYKVNIFKHFNIISDFQSIRVLKLKEKLEGIWQSANGLDFPEGSSPWTTEFRGIKASTLQKFEAFTVRNDDFENRIVFPIRDITGLIRVFIGRHIYSDVSPRYLIKPEKTSPPLFPYNVKPINNSIVLVEGIFDALNLHDKGLTNAVCTFGTNTLAKTYEEKLTLFKLQGVTKIYIMFDGDNPGRSAAEELKALIESMDFACDIIDLPDESDPGELTQKDVTALRSIICPK